MQIDTYRILDHCSTPIEDYHSLGNCVECGVGLHYTHITKGAKVLAVAHLDTVMPILGRGQDSWGIFKKSGQVVGVASPHLDDRLGVYTILELLPQMGIEVDVLLTEGEELGRSTAEFFLSPVEYNWVVEFDRKGDDVVLYDYYDQKWAKRIEKFGFNVGNGTFSDISELEHLGVKALNIGIGYYQQHTVWCYADLCETLAQLKKFKSFYNSNKGKRFEHSITQKWQISRGALKSTGEFKSIYSELVEAYFGVSQETPDNEIVDEFGMTRKQMEDYVRMRVR